MGALRRLYLHLFELYQETHEYHDQALIQLLLLRNQSLGIIDDTGRIFLGLHGHDDAKELMRPLCRGSHFIPRPAKHWAPQKEEEAEVEQPKIAIPVPGYVHSRHTFDEFMPP